ncbi:RING/U-box superfamily protein [Striga hermonthica]|uniref:RING/U-box superfamily protein n=1 Tax=Striga hermonthica TaxID=68872 RepID=A0A9N7NSQ0_STRHE|nr:RING/U-box superfamily protein [Striga hermonthica]
MAFKNMILSMLAKLLGPPPVCENAVPKRVCAVCLSSLNGGEVRVTRVLPCQHEFHVICVDRWLAVPCFKSTCPVCRFSIDDCEPIDCFFTDEMVIWFSSFHVAGF